MTASAAGSRPARTSHGPGRSTLSTSVAGSWPPSSRLASASGAMDTFGLSTREHEQWAESFTAGGARRHRAQGLPFACVSVDVARAFPGRSSPRLVDLLCAERIERRGPRCAARACRQVRAIRLRLGPEVWRQFGCTCRVILTASPFRRDRGLAPARRRLEWCPASEQRPMHFPALDVLASAARSERVPHSSGLPVCAVAPVGPPPPPARAAGLVLDGEADPAVSWPSTAEVKRAATPCSGRTTAHRQRPRLRQPLRSTSCWCTTAEVDRLGEARAVELPPHRFERDGRLPAALGRARPACGEPREHRRVPGYDSSIIRPRPMAEPSPWPTAPSSGPSPGARSTWCCPLRLIGTSAVVAGLGMRAGTPRRRCSRSFSVRSAM